jgi:hypothetical protein
MTFESRSFLIVALTLFAFMWLSGRLSGGNSQSHSVPVNNSLFVVISSLPLALLLWLALKSTSIESACVFFRAIMFHEMGHAIVAWLCGREAYPFSFVTTVKDDFSVVAFAVVVGLATWFGLHGRRTNSRVAERIGWTIVLLTTLCSVLVPMPIYQLMVAAGGPVGEVLLSACMCALFFYDLKIFSWGHTRFFVCYLGLTQLAKSALNWAKVLAGQQTLPMGSLLRGKHDPNGDMQQIMARTGLGPEALAAIMASLTAMAVLFVLSVYLISVFAAIRSGEK